MASFKSALAGRHQIQYRVSQDVTSYVTDRSSPDETWTFTDAAGHEHHYDHGYPTLAWIVEEQHWCDGTEGIYNHDGHWVDDVAHWECRICGEVIEPRLHPPGRTVYVPGPKSAEASGFRSDGSRITCWLTEEDSKALEALLRARDSDGVQRWLDEFPEDRIVSIEYFG